MRFQEGTFNTIGQRQAQFGPTRRSSDLPSALLSVPVRW